MADINARPPDEGDVAGLTLHHGGFYGNNGRDRANGQGGLADINARTPNEGEEEKKWRYIKSIIP